MSTLSQEGWHWENNLSPFLISETTDWLETHGTALSRSLRPLSCAYIHLLIYFMHSLLKWRRTGGQPLVLALFQRAFLLILKMCHTVNLFRSQNLFKWISCESFIIILFICFLQRLFERTPVFVSVGTISAYFPRKDTIPFWLWRNSISTKNIFLLYPHLVKYRVRWGGNWNNFSQEK